MFEQSFRGLAEAGHSTTRLVQERLQAQDTAASSIDDQACVTEDMCGAQQRAQAPRTRQCTAGELQMLCCILAPRRIIQPEGCLPDCDVFQRHAKRLPADASHLADQAGSKRVWGEKPMPDDWMASRGAVPMSAGFRTPPDAVSIDVEARVGAGIHQQRQLGAMHLCIWRPRDKHFDCLFQAAERVRCHLTALQKQ
jgi:hypothetical protein